MCWLTNLSLTDLFMLRRLNTEGLTLERGMLTDNADVTLGFVFSLQNDTKTPLRFSIKLDGSDNVEWEASDAASGAERAVDCLVGSAVTIGHAVVGDLTKGWKINTKYSWEDMPASAVATQSQPAAAKPKGILKLSAAAKQFLEMEQSAEPGAHGIAESAQLDASSDWTEMAEPVARRATAPRVTGKLGMHAMKKKGGRSPATNRRPPSHVKEDPDSDSEDDAPPPLPPTSLPPDSLDDRGLPLPRFNSAGNGSLTGKFRSSVVDGKGARQADNGGGSDDNRALDGQDEITPRHGQIHTVGDVDAGSGFDGSVMRLKSTKKSNPLFQ
jgi:hypothetical protein